MPESQSKTGKTTRQLGVFGSLVLAAVLSGALGLLLLLSAFITDSPERTAAEPMERQSGVSTPLPESGPPLQVGDRPYAFALEDPVGLTFPALLDPESSVVQSYGTGNFLPSSVFIAPNGEITAIHRGPLTRDLLAQYLEQTLPDRTGSAS